MFTEMMPMGGGGGDSLFNAVSRTGTATAKQEITIETGLSEVHAFVLISFIDATNDTYCVTCYDDSYDASHQLTYANYANTNYPSFLAYPYTSSPGNVAYSVIKQINGGDVDIVFSANGSGVYKWFAI